MTLERAAPRDGEPYQTDVGRFVAYRVKVETLPVSLSRSRAIVQAKVLALQAGLKVVDVAQATYQADDRFLVELQVEP
jgi:hypothetical protein